MHVLAAQAGRVDDGDEPVDLAQSPGDIVFLSAAETELSAFALDARGASMASSLRLASLLQLKHPYSVDLYADNTLAHAKLIVVRLIGGEPYWSYGMERLTALAHQGIKLMVMPHEGQWNADLAGRSTVAMPLVRRFWQLCVEGGPANRVKALQLLDALARGEQPNAPEVSTLPRFGLCDPKTLLPSDASAAPGSIPIVIYTSLLQAGTTAPVRALCGSLSEKGLAAQPVFVPSLKDAEAVGFLDDLLGHIDPPVILNTTAFASTGSSDGADGGPLSVTGAPVVQAVLSGLSREAWAESSRGLPGTDLVMHVAIPELDGRIHGRAISFKRQGERDPLTEFAPVAYAPEPSHVEAVASLAARWAKLRDTPAGEKRVGIILANYPTKTSRIGNGVGLDTPASAGLFLEAMDGAGYQVGDAPRSSEDLMALLLSKAGRERYSLADYQAFFDALPQEVRQQVTDRWGEPYNDPQVAGDAFTLPLHRFGNTLIGIQPARGYNVDPASTYHDPDLVPPHGYLAFYAYLRQDSDVLVQFGKHGNLEWLPGKALALSDSCFPAAILGDLPTLYPFIVNDPGEGCQAKRRTAAVILDHLTPPLTRAESHGPYQELEALLDDYAFAEASDPRRAKALARDIVGFAQETGLAEDIGLKGEVGDDLITLDAALCDLKEMQIRDGLHIFGKLPEKPQVADILVAIARLPRGSGEQDASLTRALASDFGLDFDPLTRDFGQPWTLAKPEALDDGGVWRTLGDGIERLEAFALKLVQGDVEAPSAASQAVMQWIDAVLRPRITSSPDDETANLLAGLAGRFVPPGPSGAPSRARPDVLPTGRNFFAVDVRAVPSPTAWRIGQKSAEALLSRHFQDYGEWLQSLVLTCWGTANMRTGGDDIAQALALIGVAPEWDGGSGRVTGFEITSLSKLRRPRVDVTLRISGFFRDAFPHQIELFDSAVRAVADLDEPADMNPLAARVQADQVALLASGKTQDDADRMAGYRVFGSMPGAYGAGLQALIDEGGWTQRSDFAEAFIAWGGFAYGAGRQGDAEKGLLKDRLRGAQAVVQNQDNREHDLLDSDDYYQFEGGLAATIETLRGEAPTSYHVDHARPEAPHPRTLQEEIGRVVRGRASNPKWIAGVMRHGYKGAFEMAATLDYLFAFAATTQAVSDHHFDALFEAYIADDDVRDFIKDANAPALNDMLARFAEALDRGLWTPRRNTTQTMLNELMHPNQEAAE
ncbi:MAG: cobaltochelatase subunit CobN [Rhizobiales bacterium]|nr:cobaltochelatase subunit CobN [Hyphomicrobiales bacterium]MBO6698870.1 cobaltochelatase subunit CobN [Hyphomicrobiales bacterium]MBO6734877.1 cobaltochelatase subunit CobN [Hyphomicrobiales bacterium]MBO6911317.1 cobaltochelatase subunit CobN [Hyphomicrobiales bacterium]MBO6956185.1 cobaltochelatase subunit CobN [Hyphomicrobiales bacterium]